MVPTNVNPNATLLKDHFYDGVGVIRLLDQFSNLVYSLSYGGNVSGSDLIPPVQTPGGGETNSIGLAGNGSACAAFEWNMGGLTIGSINAGQTLVKPRSGTNAYAWHAPGQKVTPLDTNEPPPFFLFNPQDAGHFSTIDIYYGYTNASYPNPSGTLRHRQGGVGAPWNFVAMNVRTGSLDANNHEYVYGRIPDHTYQRLQTIEYVIDVDPNTHGIDNVYLGSDAGGLNASTIYTNFTDAEVHPFTYSIPIADLIGITNVLVGTTNVTLQTSGNDPVDPITNFIVKFTTNLLVSSNEWVSTNFIPSQDASSNFSFNMQRDTSIWPKAFFRIDPRWP